MLKLNQSNQIFMYRPRTSRIVLIIVVDHAHGLFHLPVEFTELEASSGLDGLVVSALDFQAGYRGFEFRSGRDNFQSISTPSLYSTCPVLSIKWTGRRFVTDSGTKCAWVIHESKAVQIHVHNNRRCLHVPRHNSNSESVVHCRRQ